VEHKPAQDTLQILERLRNAKGVKSVALR
jgi:hypothetical protein